MPALRAASLRQDISRNVVQPLVEPVYFNESDPTSDLIGFHVPRFVEVIMTEDRLSNRYRVLGSQDNPQQLSEIDEEDEEEEEDSDIDETFTDSEDEEEEPEEDETTVEPSRSPAVEPPPLRRSQRIANRLRNEGNPRET